MIFHSEASLDACLVIGLPSGDCITIGMKENVQEKPALA